jgi:hypothetical protein
MEFVFHNQQGIPKVDTFALVSLFKNTLPFLSYVIHDRYRLEKYQHIKFLVLYAIKHL